MHQQRQLHSGNIDQVRHALRRQFQHRKVLTEDGILESVVTHTQLVEHLLQKSLGHREYLAFDGMNQVVFKR